MRTTFTLELRMDIASDEQRAIINEALRISARQLYAQAVMLNSDRNRSPQIMVKSDNSFDGMQTLDLHDNDDELNPQE